MVLALILAALVVVIVLYGSRPWEHHQRSDSDPQTDAAHEGQVMPPAA